MFVIMLVIVFVIVSMAMVMFAGAVSTRHRVERCRNFAHLGAEAGEPRPARGENLAQTTIYTARSRAIVFNTGTLGWELGLEPVPSASPDAPRTPSPFLVAMTRAMLARVLATRSR